MAPFPFVEAGILCGFFNRVGSPSDTPPTKLRWDVGRANRPRSGDFNSNLCIGSYAKETRTTYCSRWSIHFGLRNAEPSRQTHASQTAQAFPARMAFARHDLRCGPAPGAPLHHLLRLISGFMSLITFKLCSGPLM